MWIYYLYCDICVYYFLYTPIYVYIPPYLDIVKERSCLGFVQRDYLKCVKGKCTMESGKVELLGQRKALFGNSFWFPA